MIFNLTEIAKIIIAISAALFISGFIMIKNNKSIISDLHNSYFYKSKSQIQPQIEYLFITVILLCINLFCWAQVLNSI